MDILSPVLSSITSESMKKLFEFFKCKNPDIDVSIHPHGNSVCRIVFENVGGTDAYDVCWAFDDLDGKNLSVYGGSRKPHQILRPKEKFYVDIFLMSSSDTNLTVTVFWKYKKRVKSKPFSFDLSIAL